MLFWIEKDWKQILRYGIAGACLFGFNYLLYQTMISGVEKIWPTVALLYGQELSTDVAMASELATVIVAYIVSVGFVFEIPNGQQTHYRIISRFFHYVICVEIFIAILMQYFEGYLGSPGNWAKIYSETVIIPFSFAVRKYYIFSKKLIEK